MRLGQAHGVGHAGGGVADAPGAGPPPGSNADARQHPWPDSRKPGSGQHSWQGAAPSDAVDTLLESDMAHAFTEGSNADMTSTDTQKNTVYYIAKQCSQPCSPEEFAILLARHFVHTYPKVSKAKVWVEQAPWKRATLGGQLHKHGFSMSGSEVRTCAVSATAEGRTTVTAGAQGLRLLKTTQSGYEGFLHDRFTLLPDTRERIMASCVTASWRYTAPAAYDAAFAAARGALLEAFLGPPACGVYSPSVQHTLFQMGRLLLERVPQADSVFLNMPNLHFLPCSPVTAKFEDDVYVATSEPHGSIEATVTRGEVQPHCKL
ncbi:hypothetical protein WJX81_004243 [Elliptochloris bilobata]|uniref:Uricase n=1 Tax=Elliptochloris bilobata TaxID=381761 RepID=A0AAW1RDM5_9CHLO